MAADQADYIHSPGKNGHINFAPYLTQDGVAGLSRHIFGRDDDMCRLPEFLRLNEADSMTFMVDPALLGVVLEMSHQR